MRVAKKKVPVPPQPPKVPIKKPIKTPVPVALPTPLTSLTSPPVSASASASAPTTVPTAPLTPASPAGATGALSAAPEVPLPALPSGFVPVIFKQYLGAHPKSGQITAVPGAIAELESSTSYVQAFGGGVPPASRLAGDLSIAASWTTLRMSLEAFLVYAKSNEVIAWKEAFTELDELNAVFQVVAKQNPQLVAGFPATKRLLGVTKAISEAGAATKARKAKASTAKTAPAPAAAAATTASTTSPTAPTSAPTGGAAH